MKNKKYVVTGLTCVFLLIAGICYSCAYQKDQTSAVTIDSALNTGKSKEIEEKVSMEGQMPSGEVTSAPVPDAGQAQTEQKSLIYVHLCGAVALPGVYQAEEGTRLVDMIALAGGLTEAAAGDYINQAEQVTDGQRIYIPTEKEMEDLPSAEYLVGAQGGADEKGSGDSSLININTADAGQLMSLPGIGEAKAKSILDYRTNNGNFQTIEELMKIPGIKQGLFNQLSSMITVE